MLFFKRILNFTRETAAQSEKRHAKRYAVSPDSPVEASLTMNRREQGSRLVNISSSGVSLEIQSIMEVAVGSSGRLKLTLDDIELSVGVQLAHVSLNLGYTLLGLELKFDNFDTKGSYLQLLEPVAIGQGLTPGDPKLVREKEPGISTVLFHGPGNALLTVWRDTATQNIRSFELRMHDYYVRSGPTAPNLDIFTCEEQSAEHKSGYDVPALKRAGADYDEILQLYRWVVPHLNRKLPADVRSFLKLYASLR
ncbi:MAG: PilZ domain-containing protein [Cephaloticoccus sp.]|nr:PilZ domain-containing protein [Cephaloticoccus sp.]MCF7759504.1 PilZ domain-containing protein [Cephaloticoccus sp.]